MAGIAAGYEPGQPAALKRHFLSFIYRVFLLLCPFSRNQQLSMQERCANLLSLVPDE
jgi:hypothetical protein